MRSRPLDESKRPKPVEAQFILSKLDSETLQEFSAGVNTSFFKAIESYVKRYSETKRQEILDLQEYYWKRLAIDKAKRSGGIFSLAVFLHVVKGASAELAKRKEE